MKHYFFFDLDGTLTDSAESSIVSNMHWIYKPGPILPRKNCAGSLVLR